MTNEFNNYDYNYDEINDDNDEEANGFWEGAYDALGHGAQGVAMGWSDELMGLYGGLGRVMANGTLRALGYSVNGESFADAWFKGYTDYRDFARQELSKGNERNPVISGGSEVLGAAFSPIKLAKPKGYTGSTLGNFIAHPVDIARARWKDAILTGAVNGIGSTDYKNNTWEDYAKNIGMGVAGNIGGTYLGNATCGAGNMMYPIQRGMTNAGVQSVPYIFGYKNNEEDEEYNNL